MSQTEQDVVVLVADDEPSTLALVASHVRSKGYKVLEASDGDQAWQLAHEHLPDLVILDVMMPGMSGWEVCRKIREAVSLAHTGVIMLTGIGENLNEMTSPLYGADAYLDKPFEFTELDARVTSTLAERREGAMGRPDPEATERRASQPPPAGANGMSTALAAPAAKRRARAAKVDSDAPVDSGAKPTQRLALNRPTKRISPARADAAAKKSEQSSSKSKRAGATMKVAAPAKGKTKAAPKKAAAAKPKAVVKAKPAAAKTAKSAPKTKAAKKAGKRAAAPKAKAKAAPAKVKARATKAKAGAKAKTAAPKAAARGAKGRAAAPKAGAAKGAKKAAAKAAPPPKKPARAAPKPAQRPAAAARKSSNGATRKASPGAAAL